MKKTGIVLLMIVTISCHRKPFVNHKLTLEKTSSDCKDKQSYFRMLSDFGGERYEFEKCLALDFKKSQLDVTRQGDTVVVKFPQFGDKQPMADYHVTLDIDSYPMYHFITVDDDTYPIVPSEK